MKREKIKGHLSRGYVWESQWVIRRNRKGKVMRGI